MNVAVISLKWISKSFIKFIIFTFCLSLLIKFLILNVKSLQKFFTFESCSYLFTSFFSNINQTENKINSLDIFKSTCPIIVAMNSEIEIPETNDKVINTEINNEIIISKEAKTEPVSERNIEENYNITTGTTKIRNQSNYEMTEDILSINNFSLSNTKKVLIYHTHTCESYTPCDKYNYTMTGNYRTTDNNYNVVKLGDELTKILTSKGFEVIHDSTYHDYPTYSGSYDRSLQTAQNIINQNKDVEIVIDLHRDAVGDGTTYGPTVKIDGKSVAQMMFVIGTDGGGLEHPNWQQNVKTAIKLQETANKMYPGLFRPMIIRNSRYNQHIAPGALIVEVGATANTLDECLLSVSCLANILEETWGK